MFRRYSIYSTVIRQKRSKSPLRGRYLTGFTFAILGTLYYARHTTIYADMPSAAHSKKPEVHMVPKDDSASHHDEMPDRWNDPYYYDKIREHSITGRIQGESGIGRIDAASVPKFVSQIYFLLRC